MKCFMTGWRGGLWRRRGEEEQKERGWGVERRVEEEKVQEEDEGEKERGEDEKG